MKDVIPLVRIKKILKNISTLVILGVLIFGFVCAGGHHNTIIPKSEIPTNVSILSINVDQPCCLTSISNNFDSWKNVIMLVPEKIRESLMLLVLSLALSIVFNWFIFKFYRLDPLVLKLKLYLKKILNFKLFNYLNLALIQGILNPKTH